MDSRPKTTLLLRGSCPLGNRGGQWGKSSGPRQLEVAPARRLHQRGPEGAGATVRVGPVLQQCTDHVDPAPLGGEDQDRPAAVVHGVRLGPLEATTVRIGPGGL